MKINNSFILLGNGMKKSLMIISLSVAILSIAGCKPLIFDGDWMVKPDNQIYCENRWWNYIAENFDDWWWGLDWCYNPDTDIFCPVTDIVDRECVPWFSSDFIEKAKTYCEDENWTLWEDTRENSICVFDDKSFCYSDDYYLNDCKPWQVNLETLDYYESNYPYAEQACFDSNGQLSENESWEEICILDDENNFCLVDDILKWKCEGLKYSVQDVIDIHEEERAYQEYVAECYDEEQETVCGKDWNPYYNRCFMEKAGVEEETELAEVVSGQCIYG